MADVTPGPLLTAHLFPTLDAHLIDLLRSLAPDDWERQTIAPMWKVKDVAAHLLDTKLRSCRSAVTATRRCRRRGS